MNPTGSFASRHLGISSDDMKKMLELIDVPDLDTLIGQTIPDNILRTDTMKVPEPLTEQELLLHLDRLDKKNKSYKTYIGRGYYQSFTPPVILRNIFQNPGWYTQYTPYQAEIAQGRLEALLNFQTMVSDLTGLPIANASLLDEATAAAEAMSLMFASKNKRAKTPINKLFVDEAVFKATKEVLKTRAVPLGIEIVFGEWSTVELDPELFFGCIVQFPNANGEIPDYQKFASKQTEAGTYLTVIADILSLCLLEGPGHWGADIVVGSTQRFGIPVGFGGPHAAYFATKDQFKRMIPGRIIGVSEDRNGNPALRMALQTREQHIKRERATSNICTAQALLAIMAGMYAVYHGKEGLQDIANTINQKAQRLAKALAKKDYKLYSHSFFDTIRILNANNEVISQRAEDHDINLFFDNGAIQLTIDECTTEEDLQNLATVFEVALDEIETHEFSIGYLERTSDFLTHPVFNTIRTESQMMRYIKRLENKDLSLVHSMIPLGSCTMKLNAASQLMPVSFPTFSSLHPMVPKDQAQGYMEMLHDLEAYLSSITGFEACSLQPNSGAQGEYAGLLTIRNYFESKGQSHRNIALIPASAHGTNPASAIMAGMKVVVVACDDRGNIDVGDLLSKANQYKDNLAAFMVTYPSTHGVFESSIKDMCQIIHDNGGLVYMDGANMNAQVGLTSPAHIGTDVCHLNLHKTFSIPHGGGGPGMGPICCTADLEPFLPGHFTTESNMPSVSSAAYGSASILLISYAYIRMLGVEGMIDATKVAILNANYLKAQLEQHYKILYTGEDGRAAHEFIIDLRPFKAIGVGAEEVAKRLMDYGFHAPTMSFPVPGTIMIEPTESEDLAELNRFCDAMIAIKHEIDEVALGNADVEHNVLVNAPHTLAEVCSDEWTYNYSREKAAFPLDYIKERGKFWPSTARIDNAKGDRNLICTCPDIESYTTDA